MILYSYANDTLNIHHSVDKNPNPYNFPMHVHDKFELYYFMAGKGRYTVEGNDYELTPGCIMLMRDAETHKLHIDPDFEYERFVVHFAPEDISFKDEIIYSLLYDHTLGQNNMIMCNNSSLTFISSCFDRIQRAMILNASKQEIISMFTPILYEIAYVQKNSAEHHPEYKNNTEKLVSDIIAYINNNLTEIKNMEFIEQNFYFSRSYLNRIFKKATGSTIWDYIIVKRLMRARMLIQSGKSASSVCLKCGFADYSSFYRQYKQRFGISPSHDKSISSSS